MLSSGSHRAMLARLLERMAQPPKRKLEMASYADSSIARARDDIEALLPVPPEDVDRLHRLRIRFKRLRYSAEMLRGAWTPDEARAVVNSSLGRKRLKKFKIVAEAASKLQKRLGLLHDADQALLALEAEQSLPGEGQAAIEQGLVDLRTRLVQRALESISELPPEVRP
jgi:CHAD domain-containing protein